jgi:hypothetical protein
MGELAMAALSDPSAASLVDFEQRERRFFLAMATAIAAIVLAGFGGYILAGISSFDAPWWVHFHAVTYMGWIVLYLNQNWLIVRGNLARHQQMGKIMAGWAIAMVVIGTALLFASVAAQRSPPPIFTAAMLFVMDEINVLLFAGLVAAGLVQRHRSDWHRRLMLSATVCIIAPALGRITVLTIGFSWPAIILAQIALLAVAGGFDLRTRGRVHPALLWGAAGIAAMGLVVPPLAELPAVISFANSVAGDG